MVVLCLVELGGFDNLLQNKVGDWLPDVICIVKFFTQPSFVILAMTHQLSAVISSLLGLTPVLCYQIGYMSAKLQLFCQVILKSIITHKLLYMAES